MKSFSEVPKNLYPLYAEELLSRVGLSSAFTGHSLSIAFDTKTHQVSLRGSNMVVADALEVLFRRSKSKFTRVIDANEDSVEVRVSEVAMTKQLFRAITKSRKEAIKDAKPKLPGM